MKTLRQILSKLLLVALVLVLGLLIYLDALVSTTFADRKWEIPARVYSRPLELFPGLRLAKEELHYELSLLGYRKVTRLTQPGQWVEGRNRLDFYGRSFRFPDEMVPAARLEVRFSGNRVTSIRSAGRALELVRLEPVHIGGIYPRHREDRLLLQLDKVPKTMVAGLLAMEDRQFYSHWGISVTGILRAMQANYQAGRVVQGGSTITQQLVKNYYLSSERSLWRKSREALMALLLEFHFDKSEILEGYINEVFLSQDGPRAIHGFGLASEYFFDRSLAELGIHQQALLVGMVKGPSLYNPLRNPERALARRNTVLDVMYQQGIINDVEQTVSKAMPLALSQRTRVVNSYPAYLALVRRQLRQDYHEQDLGSLGLSIFTGFDPLLQRQAERSVEAVLPRLPGGEQLETAMVVTSFDNGEVKALLGGRKPRYAGFNRALDAVRPVGSLIKPAVYLTALQDPAKYTLATPLSDAPVTVASAVGDDWQPRNFDRQSHGDPLLHKALAQSYNQATARLGMQVGIEEVLDTLRRLGVERRQPAVPALMLGAGGLAPVDIAAMYQTIAAGGFRLPLHTIRDVVDARGTVVQRFPLHYEREVSIQAIHLLHYALREVMEEGTGKSVRRSLPRDFAVAGKTGTTNDNRDSWFAGFSGDLMAVSWVGRDDNGGTGLTGATGALKIWADFMSTASRVPLAYRVPEGIEHYWIDPASGQLSAEDCEGARLMPFISGSQPQKRVNCAQRKDRVMEWFRDLF
ncbi:penicillin-binding protein 1B [Halieaceae bacterium IMCC14734]|uniref:Penicillin-binding protein 1B n=1 Tax=Candidatus Litorirhabdus singularis TaxID=2518993 RepID=A0ABT3TLY3_9GAMM|nr:penicillin-binding protein 1B [Candidatus Litorirhabdus singularis]MCX2983332.1 penicillin-binding protein 1B [Candidatus Litorirhabdus singularis]